MNKSLPRVFVVDDDAAFLSGITRLLRVSGHSVEGFSSAADFLNHVTEKTSGCIVTDLEMPGMNGIQLQAVLAQSENPLPVVFLTGRGDIPTGVKAMRNGAEDFILKTAPKEAILSAVERALQRNKKDRQQRSRRRELMASFSRITPRENLVLRGVLRGQLNKQIAMDLDITERSVKRHRANLMKKLGVDSVAELTKLAVEAGVADDQRSQTDTHL